MVELAQISSEAEALLVVVPAAGALGAGRVASSPLVLGGRGVAGGAGRWRQGDAARPVTDGRTGERTAAETRRGTCAATDRPESEVRKINDCTLEDWNLKLQKLMIGLLKIGIVGRTCRDVEMGTLI